MASPAVLCYYIQPGAARPLGPAAQLNPNARTKNVAVLSEPVPDPSYDLASGASRDASFDSISLDSPTDSGSRSTAPGAPSASRFTLPARIWPHAPPSYQQVVSPASLPALASPSSHSESPPPSYLPTPYEELCFNANTSSAAHEIFENNSNDPQQPRLPQVSLSQAWLAAAPPSLFASPSASPPASFTTSATAALYSFPPHFSNHVVEPDKLEAYRAKAEAAKEADRQSREAMYHITAAANDQRYKFLGAFLPIHILKTLNAVIVAALIICFYLSGGWAKDNHAPFSQPYAEHPTLITPAEWNFYIWYPILLLLVLFVGYQWLGPAAEADLAVRGVGISLALGCSALCAWFFVWEERIPYAHAILMFFAWLQLVPAWMRTLTRCDLDFSEQDDADSPRLSDVAQQGRYVTVRYLPTGRVVSIRPRFWLHVPRRQPFVSFFFAQLPICLLTSWVTLCTMVSIAFLVANDLHTPWGNAIWYAIIVNTTLFLLGLASLYSNDVGCGMVFAFSMLGMSLRGDQDDDFAIVCMVYAFILITSTLAGCSFILSQYCSALGRARARLMEAVQVVYPLTAPASHVELVEHA